MNHHKREGNLFISNSNLNDYIINNKYSKLAHNQLPYKIRDYNLFTKEIGQEPIVKWEHFFEDPKPLMEKLSSAKELICHETKDPEIKRKITQIQN